MRGQAALALVGLLLLAPPAQALTLVDMLGREVTLPAPPRRIVSLVPSVTELLFALGAEDRLAGVTDFCDWPPAARDKPSVGGMINPSIEMIAALRPDLVVATDSGNRRETLAQLDAVGIPVYLVRANRIAEMIEVARRLGALTEHETAVAPLVARVQARIRDVQRVVASRPRLRVLYVLWPEPLIVPGREAIVTELIALAGGRSITAEEASDYPRFSMEAAVARAPEVIVLARHGTRSGPMPSHRWDRLASMPAVQAGRIHAVNGDLLHRYGPRLVEGLEQLARAIHPEAFR